MNNGFRLSLHGFRLGILACCLVLSLASAFAPLALAQPSAAVLEAENSRIAAMERGVRSAVSIFANDGNGGGSGVVISPDGFAVTNFHVVEPTGTYMQCSMADGKLYDAVLVGIDPVGDVALIKLLGREDFPAATLADSDTVRRGDWCFAIGNPFLLATDFQPTVTSGIVSGTQRYQYPSGTLIEYTDCIQTDTSINPGNSGGPLFNATGEVIGINGRISFEKRVRVNVGVGYAISINQVKHFLGCLHSGRILDHATLGASFATAQDGRVLVSNILETSDAYHRGLRADDELVAFGGRAIRTTNGFKNVLGIFPKGYRVPMVFRRGGKTFENTVRLTGVHGDEELIALVQKPKRSKGGEKPGPRPKEKPEKLPEKGLPPGSEPEPPEGGKEAKTAIPASAQALIKARPGYANYYFNEKHQQRVWQAATARGDFSSAAGVWKIRVKQGEGKPFLLELGTERSQGDFPTGLLKIDSLDDLAEQLGPPQSGGLLTALHLWRTLLVEGPTKYGEVFYYGTLPWSAAVPAADVLVATRNVVESNFIFDPATGELAALEVFPDVDADPCLIRFEDYREVQGRQFPHRWVVRHADREFGTLEVEAVEFVPAGGAQP